jgi:Zn-dependent protease with chaperone function
MIREYWKRLNKHYGVFQAKYFLDGFEGLEELDFGDFSREAILFKHSDIMGVSLGANQIMLNEKLTLQENESARAFILFHEEGHSRDNSILNILTGLSQTVLTPLGFGIMVLGLIISILQDPLTSLSFKVANLERIIYNTIAFMLIFLTASIFSYVGETRADLFVIENLGKERFIQTDKELQKLSDRDIIEKVFWRLSHPPASLTVQIYEKLFQ